MLDRPDIAHVAREIPRNSRLVKEVGTVRISALQQRPDPLVKMWLKQSNDVVVDAIVLRIGLMEKVTFAVNVDGPDDNLLIISWTEPDAAPDVTDDDMIDMRLVVANTSGGEKHLSFLLEGIKLRENIPPMIKCLHGSSYQITLAMEQLFGAENESNTNLTLSTGMSSANAQISQAQRSM